MPPLRGLWNSAPDEGDRYVNAELDWLSSPPGSAVQFQLAGSSPVALSQIVALAVDNAASGADVQFIFPDSGFVLSIPARTSGVWPVFTNALMFYASAPAAIAGDRTVFQAFNSMPPPVPIPASQAQNHASTAGIAAVNGSTQLVPVGVSGTLNLVNGTITMWGGAGGGETCQLSLIDGRGITVWQNFFTIAANGFLTTPFDAPGLAVRFANGLSLLISNSNLSGGSNVVLNVYYSQP